MEINYEKIKEKLKEMDLQRKAQIIALLPLLQEKKQLDEQMDKELDKCEEESLKQTQPLQERQNEIIAGTRAIEPEEVKDFQKYAKDDEKPEQQNVSPIAEYWLKVFKNSKTLATLLGKNDEPILKHLLKIDGYDNRDQNKCGLVFTFSDNEHFTNKELKIEFLIDQKQQEAKHVQSTEINWNQGKNIAYKTIKKKKKGQTKVKKVEQQSFFNIFRNINTEDDTFVKADEQKKDELKQKLEISYDVARLIHDEILPYSLEYYLNVHVEDGSDDDEEEEEEFDEDEEEEDINAARERMKQARGGGKKKK